MTRYYVDSENVGNAWLALLPELKKGDKVYLMSSPCANTATIPFTFLTQYANKMQQVTMVPCTPVAGENAMDFQICGFVGTQLGTASNASTEDIILSNDKGYDPLISFWKAQERHVERYAIGNSLTAGKTYFCQKKNASLKKENAISEKTNVRLKLLYSNPKFHGKNKDRNRALLKKLTAILPQENLATVYVAYHLCVEIDASLKDVEKRFLKNLYAVSAKDSNWPQIQQEIAFKAKEIVKIYQNTAKSF